MIISIVIKNAFQNQKPITTTIEITPTIEKKNSVVAVISIVVVFNLASTSKKMTIEILISIVVFISKEDVCCNHYRNYYFKSG